MKWYQFLRDVALFVDCSSVTNLVLYILFAICRRSCAIQILQDHRIQPANNINNQRYNPSLINHWEILIVAMYFNLILLFFIFMSQFNMILTWFIVLVNSIFVPSFFFYFNGKLRQFYQRKFWENAPTYLQRFNPDHIIETNN